MNSSHNAIAISLLIVISLLISIFSILFAPTSYAQEETRFTYHESDGVFVYYETDKRDAYRQLLPKEFDMPDKLYVQTFISDFYMMDDQTEPYKEASVFLLGELEGREVWHCIFMPVTSEQSRRAGIWRLGLPKTIGKIEFERNPPVFKGIAEDDTGRKMSLTVNTDEHYAGEYNEELLRDLSTLPRINLRNGEIIEMTRSAKRSVLDVAKQFPQHLTLLPGRANIDFEASTSVSGVHALDLTPTKILGAYYLHNKIPFRLGKK